MPTIWNILVASLYKKKKTNKHVIAHQCLMHRNDTWFVCTSSVSPWDTGGLFAGPKKIFYLFPTFFFFVQYHFTSWLLVGKLCRNQLKCIVTTHILLMTWCCNLRLGLLTAIEWHLLVKRIQVTPLDYNIEVSPVSTILYFILSCFYLH